MNAPRSPILTAGRWVFGIATLLAAGSLLLGAFGALTDNDKLLSLLPGSVLATIGGAAIFGLTFVTSFFPKPPPER